MSWVKIASATGSSVTSISIDGCFTSAYNGYMILISDMTSTATQDINVRWRASGTDESSSIYDDQYIQANLGSISAARVTGTEVSQALGHVSVAEGWEGVLCYVNQPNLAQRTPLIGMRGKNAYLDQVNLINRAYVATTTTSYDGFSVLLPSGAASFTVTVYGLRES